MNRVESSRHEENIEFVALCLTCHCLCKIWLGDSFCFNIRFDTSCWIPIFFLFSNHEANSQNSNVGSRLSMNESIRTAILIWSYEEDSINQSRIDLPSLPKQSILYTSIIPLLLWCTFVNQIRAVTMRLNQSYGEIARVVLQYQHEKIRHRWFIHFLFCDQFT